MKRIFYIFLSGTLLLASSCGKDYLETTPPGSVAASTAFSTPERVTAAMNGLYDLITTSSFNTHIALTQDIKGGDMVLVRTGNYNRFVTEYQFQQSPTAGNGGAFLRDGYKLIANTNVAITELPKTTLSDALKNDYLAEARALRAWAHLHLVRLFSQPYAVNQNALGIPVVDKVIGPNDPIPGRGTVKATYDFILADLLFAKANISTTRANNTGRFTINVVNGLLARVYLDMQQWQNAADHAKLARTGYPLAAASTLLDGFVDKTSEWIWTLVYRSDDNTGYLQIASFQEPYDIGYSTFRATTSFVNMFADNDIRKKQFYVNLDKVATYEGDALQRDDLYFSRDGFLMNKFYFRDAWDLSVPMMRSAEMWLIEAEAEAELGHDGLAQDALFAVQGRAITGATKSTNTGAALKTEIRDERRKELFGEGFRFYDLTRRKETLTRAMPDHWAALTLATGDYRNVLPIPERETDISGLEQNPGYTR
ncbi:RagB/SusD family nutrient uptake outer membrane protein [Chitinophaga sp. YIM B06452]|uniref:RagB/SusD family nutrient uptake outer membrane protein n=1 Tax=Chitinophaga sp. YIM B06452 TaxID=3082158 RepID=UPI0031FE69EA